MIRDLCGLEPRMAWTDSTGSPSKPSPTIGKTLRALADHMSMLYSKIATGRFGPGPVNISIGLIAKPKRFPVFQFLLCTTSVRTIRARCGSRLQLACMRWILRLDRFDGFLMTLAIPGVLRAMTSSRQEQIRKVASGL